MATILLVDDNPTFRRVIRDVLTVRGYTVVEAEDGVEALDLAIGRSVAVDLLLTDLLMPEMDGLELAERMRHIYLDMRVLFITGFSPDDLTMPRLDERSALLRKPITAELLLEKVKELLAIGPTHSSVDEEAHN